MKAIKKTLATAVLAAATIPAANALEVSGNVTLATDYTFRGISQTDEKGAIQGGFDIAADSGLYAGIWASNVNFDSEASTEMDYYIGYGFEVSENVTLDFSYIYFDYEGDAEFDYQEFAVALGIGDLTLSLNYSDEYFGEGGPDAYIFGAGYSFALGEETSLDLYVGYSDADEDDFFGEDDSYIDYSVGVSREIAGLSFGLTWVGTDLDDIDAADDRLVFSISKSM
jgi:uncharacterized protein (TIGR02001 family)